MNTDQVLIVIAISAYIMSTLALFTYFLSRERLPETDRHPVRLHRLRAFSSWNSSTAIRPATSGR